MTTRMVLSSLIALLLLVVVFFTYKETQKINTPINGIIGDTSFKEKYGVLPNASASEKVRIGAGAASIILGTCNLLRREKNPTPGKVTTWIDFRSVPGAQSEAIPYLVVNVKL